MRTAKTLIRLGGCPGWSVSSLGAHAILLVLSRGGSIIRHCHIYPLHYRHCIQKQYIQLRDVLHRGYFCCKLGKIQNWEKWRLILIGKGTEIWPHRKGRKSPEWPQRQSNRRILNSLSIGTVLLFFHFWSNTCFWQDSFAQPGARRCEGCRISSELSLNRTCCFQPLDAVFQRSFMTLVCTIISKVL